MDEELRKVRSDNGKKRAKKITYFIDDNNCYNVSSHYKNKKGYSYVRRNGRRTTIHRHIYQECFGDIPEGLVVRHKCDNPQCINPEHLELGTYKDNSDDCCKRGRRPKGEKTSFSKLTEKEVIEIKKTFKKGRVNKEMIRNIAKSHGVHIGTIYAIYYGNSWGHVNV